MEHLPRLEKVKRVYRDSGGSPFHVTPSGRVYGVDLYAYAKLVHLKGNARPYFSVTGEVINPRSVSRGGDGFLLGGSIHGEILHVWPELAPVVALHLAQDDGVPLHAASNAAFWAGMFPRQQSFDGDRLAQHLRVTREQAQQMTEWVGSSLNTYSNLSPENGWYACFEHFEMFTTWNQQAQEAIKILTADTVNA